MKALVLTLLIVPFTLCACSNKCEDECPACKKMEVPLVEWDSHLWKAIMLEHHPDCGCEEMLEDQWPEDSAVYQPEDGNEGDSYAPYREFREKY